MSQLNEILPGVFSAGVIGSPVIRKITRRAFMQRLTQAERIAIRKSTDDNVIDIYADLNAVINVILDLPEVEQSIDYLISLGLITTSKSDLLRDGTENET